MATQFEIDNALMAGVAYRSSRDDINRFPLPAGWTELPSSHITLPGGFEAVSFTDGARIVIAYAGTGPGLSDWDANSGLALGLGSDQLRQAALYYLEVKAANPPGTVISFTGHSLGGGLSEPVRIFVCKAYSTVRERNEICPSSKRSPRSYPWFSSPSSMRATRRR